MNVCADNDDGDGHVSNPQLQDEWRDDLSFQTASFIQPMSGHCTNEFTQTTSPIPTDCINLVFDTTYCAVNKCVCMSRMLNRKLKIHPETGRRGHLLNDLLVSFELAFSGHCRSPRRTIGCIHTFIFQTLKLHHVVGSREREKDIKRENIFIVVMWLLWTWWDQRYQVFGVSVVMAVQSPMVSPWCLNSSRWSLQDNLHGGLRRRKPSGDLMNKTFYVQFTLYFILV